MTSPSSTLDARITGALNARGRIAPEELLGMSSDEASAALWRFYERNRGRMDLAFSADALVVRGREQEAIAEPGPEPQHAAATAAVTPATVSALDELLGGAAAAPVVASPVEAVSHELPAAAAAAPAAAAPADEPEPAAAKPATPLDELLGGYSGVSAEESARKKAAAAAATAEVVPDVAAPSRGARVDDTSRLWMLWWIPTLLFPLAGGAWAWYVLKVRRPDAARWMMAVGLATGFIASLLFVRYATELAAFVTGVSRDTVITVPETPAVMH